MHEPINLYAIVFPLGPLKHESAKAAPPAYHRHKVLLKFIKVRMLWRQRLW